MLRQVFTHEIDQRRILSSLNNIGYYLAEVDTKIEENNNDTVNLIFNVNFHFILNL